MKANIQFALFFLGSLGLYFYEAYFLQRFEFELLIAIVLVLFILYFIGIKQNDKMLFVSGIAFRLIFFLAIPNLSQDFYRFIWDGELLLMGSNPYIYLPKDLVLDSAFQLQNQNKLYQGMGDLSAQHYSNYPPVNQLLFAFAALFSSKSILGAVVVMRLQIILADIGILWIGRKILSKLRLNTKWMFLYFLNPFILIELTGNLHYEGVMMFFFIGGIYLVLKQKLQLGAVLIAVSILVKLLPLLLLPLFFKQLKIKKLIPFYFLIISIVVFSFLLFYNDSLAVSYYETINLWFVNFEFNASIYYLIREIGYWIYGYNIIQSLGKITPILVVLFISLYSFFRKNLNEQALLRGFLFVLAIYFFQSTTVHPWYVVSLLLLGIFSQQLWPLLWSFLVFVSYSAYGKEGFAENYYLISLQYILVIGTFIYENFVRADNTLFDKSLSALRIKST